jgi:hypothetical protein
MEDLLDAVMARLGYPKADRKGEHWTEPIPPDGCGMGAGSGQMCYTRGAEATIAGFLFGPKHLTPSQPNTVAGKSPLVTWAARSALVASATSSKVAGGLLSCLPLVGEG